MTAARLNRFLDSLPRTRVGRAHRASPAFRACGVAGFYLALLTLFTTGLLTGKAPHALAALALASALSFFTYTALRRALTGRGDLVLLEHVWFALATNTLALLALRLPVLAHLDLVAVALCPFLAAGRLGCTLVGCCHGQPASIGITYPESHATEGFPRHLVGIRLLPVPAVEAVGLLLIGAAAFVAVLTSPPGTALAAFLLTYAILRFGLEGLRGDPRPHALGLSQARWMALAEVGVAFHLTPPPPGTAPWLVPALDAALLATLAATLVLFRRHHVAPALLDPAHLAELRDAATQAIQATRPPSPASPAVRTTSQGMTVAASPPDPRSGSRSAHLSLALPRERADLPLLCQIAARTFPGRLDTAAHVSSERLLHLRVRVPLAPPGAPGDAPAPDEARGLALYRAILRRTPAFNPLTSASAHAPLPPETDPPAPPARVDPTDEPRIPDDPAPWWLKDVVPPPRP